MAKRKKISREEMRKRVNSFRGIFKQKPGEKSVVQELLDERRAEREAKRMNPHSRAVCTGSAESGVFLFVSPK
jgi:hypothetical protein